MIKLKVIRPISFNPRLNIGDYAGFKTNANRFFTGRISEELEDHIVLSFDSTGEHVIIEKKVIAESFQMLPDSIDSPFGQTILTGDHFEGVYKNEARINGTYVDTTYDGYVRYREDRLGELRGFHEKDFSQVPNGSYKPTTQTITPGPDKEFQLISIRPGTPRTSMNIPDIVLHDVPPNYLMAMEASRRYPIKLANNKVFDFAAHGFPDHVKDYVNVQIKSLYPKDVARMIKNHHKYQSGQPIRLLACTTGAFNDGFASQLARELNSPVLAPTVVSKVGTNGVSYVENGTWRIFTPDGKVFDAGFTHFEVNAENTGQYIVGGNKKLLKKYGFE